MDIFHIVAVFVSLIALLSYLNHRVLGLPNPVGVMIMALGISLALTLATQVFGVADTWVEDLVEQFDFGKLVLDGMLGYLLFASALQLDLRALAARRWSVLLLATISTALSAAIVGGLMYFLLQAVGVELPLIYALLFGALISPTDPVAVAGLLDDVGLPEALKTIIIGESLFNDGVGIVLFGLLLGIAVGHSDITAEDVALDLLREAVGGILLGMVLGSIATFMIKRAGDFTVTVLITLAIVTGGYALATFLGTSGPIAMVAAGLLIGNRVQKQPDRKFLDAYWKVTEDLLNAALFVMIGLELLVLPFSTGALIATAVAIPVVLLSRFISVGIGLIPLCLVTRVPSSILYLLTWAGLRGGIAIALALSMPPGPERQTILIMTYGVVLFSVLVQGLTIQRVIKRLI